MKITIQHMNVRSTDHLDRSVEEQLLALDDRLVIEEAKVRLEHVPSASPPFGVAIHLVTPGPDVFANGYDHTLSAALQKALSAVEVRLAYKEKKRAQRITSNLQGPANTRQAGRKSTRLANRRGR